MVGVEPGLLITEGAESKPLMMPDVTLLVVDTHPARFSRCCCRLLRDPSHSSALPFDAGCPTLYDCHTSTPGYATLLLPQTLTATLLLLLTLTLLEQVV